MSDPRLYVWMALRRVDDGGMTKMAGDYYDRGRPTPEHLAEVFDRLVWTRLVSVAEGDPLWELRRLGLTDAGSVRYAALCERQRDSLQAPPPEHATTPETTETPAGRRSSTLGRWPLMVASRTPPCPVPPNGRATVGESPDVVIGMGLLDLAKRQGFVFRRLAPGPDGPLWGVRETADWRDTVYLSGFWAPDSCSATRATQVLLTRPRGSPGHRADVRGRAQRVEHRGLPGWGRCR